MSTADNLLKHAAEVRARPDDAMLIWRARSNLDRTDLLYMERLVPWGLKDRLRDFYRQMAENEPASSAPAAALQAPQ